MPTRRSLLIAATGALGAGIPLVGSAGAAVAADAGQDAAAVDRATIPQTLVRRRRVVARSRPSETSFPLSHLAISWTGSGQLAVRTRATSGWGEWRGLHDCRGGRDDRASGRRSALVAAPGAVEYDIAVRGDIADVWVTQLNTVTGPARALAAPAATAMRYGGGRAAPVRYLSRAAWGADESLRFLPDGTESWPPEYFPVQTLTVHHTAGANNDPDPAATVRAIYYDQAVTQGWGDIGYHLLIDETGTVYEGRWSGTDAIPVLGTRPGPDGRLPMVNAGHVVGFNAGNVGIALLGDFTSRLPTRAARRSLVAVLAVLAAASRLDPRGTADYVNPINGATARVDTISGHRDWVATECPGNTFYPRLPSVREEVARYLSHNAR